MRVDIDGSQVKKCKRCGQSIIWMQSKKGKFYPVDHAGIMAVDTTDFHRCGSKKVIGMKNTYYDVDEKGLPNSNTYFIDKKGVKHDATSHNIWECDISEYRANLK